MTALRVCNGEEAALHTCFGSCGEQGCWIASYPVRHHLDFDKVAIVELSIRLSVAKRRLGKFVADDRGNNGRPLDRQWGLRSAGWHGSPDFGMALFDDLGGC